MQLIDKKCKNTLVEIADEFAVKLIEQNPERFEKPSPNMNEETAGKLREESQVSLGNLGSDLAADIPTVIEESVKKRGRHKKEE